MEGEGQERERRVGTGGMEGHQEEGACRHVWRAFIPCMAIA